MQPFLVKSIHGENRIERKCKFKLFGVITDFFILPGLETFDGIIGLDLLNRLNAIIDLKRAKIIHDNGEEDILYNACRDVNHLALNTDDVPANVKTNFDHMITQNEGAFADPDEALPYNTNVVATIRTEDEEPVPLGCSRICQQGNSGFACKWHYKAVQVSIQQPRLGG